MKPVIRLEHIEKVFTDGKEDFEALRDVSLEVNEGDIFGIIGLSGAGKSTLVRCLNLLERPTSGKVYVNDKDMMTLSEPEIRRCRQKIGMVFQHFNLLMQRTVLGNVCRCPQSGAAHRAQNTPRERIAGETGEDIPICRIDRNVRKAGEKGRSIASYVALLHEKRDGGQPGVQRSLDHLRAFGDEDALFRLQPISQLRLREPCVDIQLGRVQGGKNLNICHIPAPDP